MNNDKYLDKIENNHKKIHELDKLLNRVNHSLYGNGEKGLIQKIDELDKKITEINKKIVYFVGFLSCLNLLLSLFINIIF